jgi:Tat protein translocase TatB subunit
VQLVDFGLDKIALIGAVALIVIGPEKLPKVARTIGHLVGKAQRYVADVRAEVNRSIELDELKKMKTEFETAARDVETTVRDEVNSATSACICMIGVCATKCFTHCSDSSKEICSTSCVFGALCTEVDTDQVSDAAWSRRHHNNAIRQIHRFRN